ncbi:MAG: methylated-DNA--[protein]-cysteine S-methyltransferase [Micrococcaceae bacterium]|nr:methylated-DNA--[protein]-cysteine S-methyltransferase [Micrococcaceae bacterium]MDN5813130.1 methylated-DNA--[protein]-cysteine S-methyltransferase [Micrococcaceae bacterium]MDN5823067.1 methylated-DNA--[protein]-cysteine S-methyltransferase [Micrococcaceae bacterium]
MLRYAYMDSPIGRIRLSATGKGLAGVHMEDHAHQPAGPPEGTEVSDSAPCPIIGQGIDELGEYFAGTRTRFDVTLDPSGTDFQQRVWALLRTIDHGTTRSYGDLAAELGDPHLSRAVGTANGRNPLSIIVPCHRVIGADGSMTGYGGGVDRKLFLLRLEGVLPSAEDQPPLF